VLIVVMVRFVPETKGQSLEEIERHWLGQPSRSGESVVTRN
jgi:hypothetical protein